MDKIVVVLVPYRDRKKHLDILLKSLHDQFEKYEDVMVHVFVAEQGNDLMFNRGRMRNLAFLWGIEYFEQTYAKKMEYAIFNDVDNWPNSNEVCELYMKQPAKKIINHIYGIGHCLNGICAINCDDYKLFDGYPDYLWSWGKEDRIAYLRARRKGIKIPLTFLQTNKNEHYVLQDFKHKRDRDRRKFHNKIYNSIVNDPSKDYAGLKESDIHSKLESETHEQIYKNVLYHHGMFSFDDLPTVINPEPPVENDKPKGNEIKS